MGSLHHLDYIAPADLVLICIQSHRMTVLLSLVQCSWLALDALAIHAQDMEILPLQTHYDTHILGAVMIKFL